MPLPPEVAHPWEEANKALEDLLAIKSAIDAHWQKLVSEFSMALCEKDSETMESIKEAMDICTHSIQKAENCCSVGIREEEVQRASQTVSIQQSHHKAVQCLKEEYIEEERKSQLPLHLRDRLAGQPSRIPWHAGSFLPHFAGTCTNVSSV